MSNNKPQDTTTPDMRNPVDNVREGRMVHVSEVTRRIVDGVAKRRAISPSLRFAVFSRDRFTCQYCGASAPGVTLHIDHIHPVSGGGDNSPRNLATSCRDCNAGKGARRLRGGDAAMLRVQECLRIATQNPVLCCVDELASMHRAGASLGALEGLASGCGSMDEYRREIYSVLAVEIAV